MTKEIAKKVAKGIADKIECNTADIDDWAEFWGFTKEDYEEFLDIAIEASTQQPILDKIKAEIEESSDDKYCYSDGMIDRDEVLEIVDKYKAESEE